MKILQMMLAQASGSKRKARIERLVNRHIEKLREGV